MLAAYKLRAVPINVNYRYVEDELAYLLDNSDAVAVVVQAQFSPLVDAVRTEAAAPAPRHRDRRRHRHRRRRPTPWSTSRPSPTRRRRATSSRASTTTSTSSTRAARPGYPKGVMWRHEDVWRVLGGGIDFQTGVRIEDEHQMSRLAKEGEPSVGLVLAPLMHGAAQWGTLGGLIRGSTSCCSRSSTGTRCGRPSSATGSRRSPSPATPWPAR